MTELPANTQAQFPMTDAEREQFIKECGRLMEQAMAAGNRQAAMDWMQAQRKAISERSPEQVALLVAEFDRRLDEGLDYFGKMGSAHAEELQAQRDLEKLDQIELQREQQGDLPP